MSITIDESYVGSTKCLPLMKQKCLWVGAQNGLGVRLLQPSRAARSEGELAGSIRLERENNFFATGEVHSLQTSNSNNGMQPPGPGAGRPKESRVAVHKQE